MQQAFATIFFVTQLNNLVVVSKSMRKQGLFYNALDRMCNPKAQALQISSLHKGTS